MVYSRRGRYGRAYRRRRPARRYVRKPRRMGRRVFRRRLPLTGFGRSKVAKMRYHDIISLNPGVGTTSLHLFRANSVFDPDETGVGHQPAGFDQWAARYTHYTVLGAKITVRPVNSQNISLVTGGWYGVILTSDAASLAGFTPNTIIENGNGKWNTAGDFENSSKMRGLRSYYSARKHFSRDPRSFDLGSASVLANPTNMAHWIIWYGTMGGLDDPSPMNVAVTIDYIVRFWERQTIGGS